MENRGMVSALKLQFICGLLILLQNFVYNSA